MGINSETSLLAALTKNYKGAPEHQTLTRLVGTWEIAGEWHLEPGHATPISGHMVNRGILGGHFIESSSFFEGEERSRVIYGYDPEDIRFTAFAISAIAPRCDLEHGHFDARTHELKFSCVEHIGAARIPVRFERTIEFLSADAFEMRITYPDFEPDKRLGMALCMRRGEMTAR
ncbi:MAG: DUF1579 family protein [Halioglobus sp.]